MKPNAAPLACLLAGLLLGVVSAQAEPASATQAFEPLRLGAIQPEGWLRAQLERDLTTGFAGHLDELLQDKRTKAYLLQATNNDYLTRAQNQQCRHDALGRTLPPGRIAWWDAEMVGDWYDSLIRAAFLTGEPKARAKAERYIARLLQSQDADGYLGIYPRGFRYHFASDDGELWTQRCALLGLLAYYEFTGRPEVLQAVERSVKLTLRQYGPGTNYFENPKQTTSGVSHGLLYVDVLEWLYRLTADDTYRQAALALYTDYSAAQAVANKDAQLARLLDPQSPLGGHGPDVMGFLRVPLLCYHLSGKPAYQQAWQNSVLKLERHLGVGGSPLSGQHEEVATSGQTPDLPYEYCSTFYLMHSLLWAMQLEGESRYGDLFERTLYNAAQGARFANGKALTYYSADERLWVRQHPPEGTGNSRYIYTAAFYPCCCHNSGARVYPYTIAALWLRNLGPDGDGLVAPLYGPCRVSTRVHDVPLTLTEKTDYPFSFQIELTLQPERAVAFPLRLRVPEWSAPPELLAPGATVSRDPRGFLLLQKTWKAGDTVRLTLKPSIHGRKALNGTMAVAYGPLVFCLPIPEKAEIIQRFPEAKAAGLKDFYGYQYDPVDVAAAKRPLRLQTAQPGFGFQVITNAQADSRYPWDHSPLALRGELLGATNQVEQVTLLPMGCTLLRRTCFPAR